MRRTRWSLSLLACAWLAGCGGSSPGTGADAGTGRVADTPARAGEVWTLAEARVSDTPSPASIAAFVEGLHSFVLDGDRVYAGSVRHDGTRQADGSLLITLSGGTQARLVKDGEGYALHLGDGEPARLEKQAEAGEGGQ